MVVIKPNMKKFATRAAPTRVVTKKGSSKGKSSAGACKWCAQGECWSHGQIAKGKGKTGGAAGIVCHNCGKPGHKSPDCRQGAGAKGGGAAGIVCHNCGKPGHKSPDCRQGAAAKGGAGAGIVCHNCGKPGHKSPDCRQGAGAKGGTGDGIVCHNCGKPGHKSPDCFQGAKAKGKGGGQWLFVGKDGSVAAGGKSKGKGKGKGKQRSQWCGEFKKDGVCPRGGQEGGCKYLHPEDPVCWQFIKSGKCKKGDDCEFLHEAA